MSAWYELTNEQLEALPTHRLYKVYQLWQKHSSLLGYRATDYFGCEDSEGEAIYQQAETQRVFIKNILGKRGHIERTEPKLKPKSKKSLERARQRAQQRSYWYRPEPAPEREGPITDPESCIGKQVFKLSKKPFKSKNRYNTVKTITQNPHTGRKAFTFEEDESIVDVHICDIKKVKIK